MTLYVVDDADILIAATTCSAGGTLVTNNTSHFQRIDRLPIENWME
jgi:predicted nucleic acid-binding protein